MRTILRIGGAALSVAVLGAVGAVCGVILSETVNRNPPIKVNQIREIGGVTYTGGRIQIYQNIVNSRSCPATVSRWIWTEVEYNHKMIRYYTPLTPALDGLSGYDERQSSYILSFQVPPNVFNGTWYYLAILKYRCGRLLPQLVAPVIEEIGVKPRIPIIINDQLAHRPDTDRGDIKPEKDAVPPHN